MWVWFQTLSRHIKQYLAQFRNLVYEVKPRCNVSRRQLKCMTYKEFKSLPKDITNKLTHSEFKNCGPTRKVLKSLLPICIEMVLLPRPT